MRPTHGISVTTRNSSYYGKDIATGKELFHKYAPGSKSVPLEFIALVHALAISDQPIYTSSGSAISIVKWGKMVTDAGSLKKDVDRAEKWLSKNKTEGRVYMWQSPKWGTI